MVRKQAWRVQNKLRPVIFSGPITLGTIRTSFVLGGRLIIQAGTLLLVARMLGPEEFGGFTGMAALAVLLGALSTCGTQLVLLSEVSKDPSRREQVLLYAIPITFICGGLLLLTYIALGCWVFPSGSISLVALIAIGCTEVVLQPLFSLMTTEHHALGRVAQAQFMQNSPLALRLLVAAGVSFFDLSPAMVIYAGGYLMASAVALLLGAYFLPKRWPGWQRWRFPAISEWRYCSGFAAINISKVAPAELDKALAMRLLPLESAGIYAAGARVIGAMVLPVNAMILSALPRLFRTSKKQSTNLTSLVVWMYVFAFACSLVLAGTLWMTAPRLTFFFGEKYQGMEEIIRLLCIATPGMALRLVASNTLMAIGEPWMRVGLEAVGLVILILSSVMLVACYGLPGMALALACSEWGMAVVGTWMAARARIKYRIKEQAK